MEMTSWKERFATSQKVLVGLGEEWRIKGDKEKEAAVRCAYDKLYELLKDKDYFIVTMATDAVIFDTPLGSKTEQAVSTDHVEQEPFSCSVDEAMMAKMNELFPPKEVPKDTRFQRITAPCGNETWRQCSVGCRKDIWEPGEIPDDICPHCGAPLVGNTMDATPYIEEGYLPQWDRYLRWLSGTFNKELVILELGVGFSKPGVIRFPFEKTAYFNQKSILVRVNGTLAQITEELAERAESITEPSVAWVQKLW
ncbi:MAG: hypothetical protein ACI39W_09380 [Brotaphodocola sp.]